MDETERKADNADRWGASLVTQSPTAQYYGADGRLYETENKEHTTLEAIRGGIAALAAQPQVDPQAVANALAANPAFVAALADALASRLSPGIARAVVDEEARRLAQ